MHKVAGQIQKNISVPILHIAEVTADKLEKHGIRKVALLGTKYTMEQDFYKNKIVDRGIDVLIPESEDRIRINDIIYNELCLGIIREESKRAYLSIIEKLVNSGAQGVILGCTEIGLLVKQSDTSIPLFDTTYLHAHRAALDSIK
jgi:aspartate racemase